MIKDNSTLAGLHNLYKIGIKKGETVASFAFMGLLKVT